jgi:alkylation response protein AidB-like acyl-CoA dehydrogenase
MMPSTREPGRDRAPGRHGPDPQRRLRAHDRFRRGLDCVRQHRAAARAFLVELLRATEIAIARQLTYFAARKNDSGERSDVQAAMAKLLAARVAWSAADASVQVHGANGVATESPVSRILADARVLGILEGSAEILAQMVARRLLEAVN